MSSLMLKYSLNATLPYKNEGLKNEGLLELEKRLSDIRLLIIDEISFVDKKLLAYIHGRLKQLKHLTRLSHAPFGNISVLSVGDFYQLSPIRSQMVCKKSHDHTDYLWSVFVLYHLDEIIRQKGDTKFSEMLNRLRVRVRVRDGKTIKPLMQEDEEFLNSREIQYDPDSSEYPHDVYHLFATWKNVHKHNALMLQRVCTKVQKITAVDTKHQGAKMYKLLSPRKKETIFQPRELDIGVGARVMLKTNLDVKDGLCNSSIGTVVHIHDGNLPHGQPECVYIKFDDERVGKELRSKHIFPPDIPKDSVPIMPLSYVLTRGKGNKIVRIQYPLVLAWAGTIHSSQGKTLQKVVVSFDRLFAKGQAYVALSRVTSSDGLYLLDLDSSKIYCDEQIIECYAVMSKLQLSLDVLPDCRTLTIVHHNVEGLNGHKNDILRCTQLFPCDVLCVTESHCQETPNTDLLPGYTYRGRSRQECYIEGTENCLNGLKNAAKGGVGIFIANPLLSNNSTHVSDLWFEDIAIEHTGISVHNARNNNSLNIICLYRPPKLSSNYFCSEVRRLLSRIPPGSATIVVGDFNEDGRETRQTVQGMFSANGYRQLINHPTTCDKNGAILDHIYISESMANNYLTQMKSGVIPTHFSFHEATYVTF